jgi:hypothetical protein
MSFSNINFAYVTFVNNNFDYINLMKQTIRSVEAFSEHPIIVYCIDVPNNTFKENDKCIIKNLSSGNITHSNMNIYYYKPYVIIDSIKNGLKNGYYIESDDLVTPNCDSIKKYLNNLDQYPISPIHPNDVPISQDYLNNLGVSKKTQPYIHAHVLFRNTNLPFLEEWFDNCIKSSGYNWDETALNCTYWKHNLSNHYLDIIDPWYEYYYSNKDNIDNIITLHGCKNSEIHANILDEMILRNKK